jgi:hypothetical protein
VSVEVGLESVKSTRLKKRRKLMKLMKREMLKGEEEASLDIF